jgi:predicted transcriptional regulator of viral defense system
LYTLNDGDRAAPLDVMFIANNIYTPSYVSLEYALYYYGLIPETVHEITSVSTAKTNTFKNHYGSFSYSTVKKELFCGFDSSKSADGMPVLIACPEKAVLDFIYLRFCRRKYESDIYVFIKKNRLQRLKTLDRKKNTRCILMNFRSGARNG